MGSTASQDVNPESSMQIVWVSEWLCNANYVAGSPGDIRTQRSMGPTAAGPAFLFWVGLKCGMVLGDSIDSVECERSALLPKE